VGVLIAPLLLVPAIGWALIEFGPERAFVFAAYPLAWSVVFLLAGTIGMLRRPPRQPASIIGWSALWATASLVCVTAVLFGVSFIFHPR